jgi:hypothetical protein
MAHAMLLRGVLPELRKLALRNCGGEISAILMLRR